MISALMMMPLWQSVPILTVAIFVAASYATLLEAAFKP
jgi:hypothetical protein